MKPISKERLKVSQTNRRFIIVLIEDITNYFKGYSNEGEFTGLNLILGSYSIHLLEGESHLINTILKGLNEYSH